MAREQNSYSTLNDVRADGCTALVMEGGDGGQTYLTCPLSCVGCTLESLRHLLDELNSLAWGDGERLYFECASIDAQAAGMWLHPDFEELNLKPAVEQILSGLTPWIKVPSAFAQLRRLGRSIPLVAGSEPVEPLSALFCAAAAGDAALVRDISARSDVNATDSEGWTALLWAAALGHTESVDVLLGASANANRGNQYFETPLMWACWQGHRRVVAALLDAGAQVNASTGVERIIDHEWRIMPQGRYAELPGQQNALIWAVQNGDLEITRNLLAAGAVVDLVDARNTTPLMRAKTAAMSQLLLDAGANVNHWDNDGRKPIHFAIEAGRIDVVHTLLAAGADTVFHFRMKEALAEAIAGGHQELVELFLDRGLDVDSPMPFRSNLLGVAVRRGQVAIANELLERGARPLNTIDMLGRTPLLDALHERLDLALLRRLLDAGANPNLSAPHNGLTALMIAARNHDLAAVETLLAAGANPHALDNANSTPLACAMTPLNPHVGGQREQVIERLLAALGSDH